MMTERAGSDIALEILASIRAELAPDLPLDLVRACYFVQKNNQYTSDRTIPMAEMEKLIDAEVDRIWAEPEGKE
jgi:hypothetical protein